jgi:hypothetical protein
MAKPTDDRDGRDESTPASAAADDRTERHLVRARELLREARSRLTARDHVASESAVPQSRTDDDSD